MKYNNKTMAEKLSLKRKKNRWHVVTWGENKRKIIEYDVENV